jgi:peptide/nickel transport system permease protein
MLNFIARRVLATVPVLAIVAVLVFLLLRLTPGDPAAILAGDAASVDQIARIRASLGLDRPIPVQFGIWVGHLATGDLGESFYYKQSVTSLIGQRLEPTLSLAVLTITLAVLVSVPLGVVAAWRFGGWFDRALMGFSVAGVSIPIFVLAYLLIWAVSLKLGCARRRRRVAVLGLHRAARLGNDDPVGFRRRLRCERQGKGTRHRDGNG